MGYNVGPPTPLHIHRGKLSANLFIFFKLTEARTVIGREGAPTGLAHALAPESADSQPTGYRAMSMDILYFPARVLVVQAARGC
jgi:hypothetical protein